MDSSNGSQVVSHNDTQTKYQCEELRQQSMSEDDCSFLTISEVLFPKDSLEALESADMQPLEDLLAKLEFENELNRVCCRQDSEMEFESPSTLAKADRMESLTEESFDTGVYSRSGEHVVIEIVLQMEQEYDLSIYFD